MADGPLLPSAELRRELHSLDGRDFHLWSMLGLLALMLVAGFLSLVLPNAVEEISDLRVETRYLPIFLFALVALVVLGNMYVLDQRRILRNTRDQLVRELVRSEAAEMLSVLDPLTEIFNRRYFDKMISKEISHVERRGGSLMFLMIDLDNLKLANTLYGHLMGDRILIELAQMLRRNFRPADTIIRYGGDEFLVLLPDTIEDQAERTVKRLLTEVDRWNAANPSLGYKMSVSCGLAAYVRGSDLAAVLEEADRQMYLQKSRKASGE